MPMKGLRRNDAAIITYVGIKNNLNLSQKPHKHYKIIRFEHTIMIKNPTFAIPLKKPGLFYVIYY
jgi:hypothetical protein